MSKPADRDLVSKISLSETEIADLIGKSRQAVNVGLRSDGERLYFKPIELANLYTACWRNPVHLALIREHVRETRPSEAEEILSANGLFLTETMLNKANDICAVIPDFAYFNIHHPAQAEMLISRARSDLPTFRIAAPSEADAKEFWRHVFPRGADEEQLLLNSGIDAAVNALPYCVFISEPGIASHENCWVLGAGGFQRHDKMRSARMYQFLMERIGGEQA